jgi:hypothetical protein
MSVDCGGANAIGDTMDFSARLIGTNDFSGALEHYRYL